MSKIKHDFATDFVVVVVVVMFNTIDCINSVEFIIII